MNRDDIDYGIDKIGELAEKFSPVLNESAEEMISFTVNTFIIEVCFIPASLMLLFGFIGKFLIKKGLNELIDSMEFVDNAKAFIGCVLFVFSAIFGMVFITYLPNVIMALNNPKMFAIKQLIGGCS